jgi:hypothetical protein
MRHETFQTCKFKFQSHGVIIIPRSFRSYKVAHVPYTVSDYRSPAKHFHPSVCQQQPIALTPVCRDTGVNENGDLAAMTGPGVKLKKTTQ